jgi:hypothetical protein
MPAVTQKTPSFLGGVSTQPDDVMKPGQVRDIVNGFPDPAAGLLKRQGTRFIAELKDTGGAVISAADAVDDGKWFSIFRDPAEKYIGYIGNGLIRIWDAATGAAKTVTYDSGTTGYINSSTGNYDVLTIYDQTFIVNRSRVVAKQADPSGVATDRNATIVLKSVEYSAKYTVTINSSTYNLTTRNADDLLGPSDPAKEILSASQVLDALKSGIDGLGISGLTVTKLDNSLELSRTSGFTISAKGGQAGDALEAFQFVAKSGGSGVSSIGRLPEKSVNNRLVKISNFSGGEDDFYVRYVAADNTWEETISPFASPGLDASTMPHVMVRNPDGTFTLKQVDWEPRLVGDDETNDHPSFVGRPVEAMFFHANRLGILSGESVVMSQASDYFNFYAASALTQVASDPIDINVSSVVPTRLHSVMPVAQGLLLFSNNQQFLMRGNDGIFTPNTVTLNSIGGWENVDRVRPVDLGVTIGFLSKTASYTRLFEMQTKGDEESPAVTELSKVVSEWVPSTIDTLRASTQNSFLTLSAKNLPDVYTLRFYTEGEDRQIEAWARWKMLGNVIHIDMYEDVIYVVTRQADRYWFQTIDLVQSPQSPQLVSPEGIKSDPRMDMWASPSSLVYNSGTDTTKVVLPYKGFSDLPARVVVVNSVDLNEEAQGEIYTPDLVVNGSEYSYSLAGNFTGKDLVVGYAFDFDVVLPRIYYRANEISDFIAPLIVARVKFSSGLSGDLNFELNVRGRLLWMNADSVKRADYYLASTVPFVEGAEFIVPIHQRNNNYTLKVTSDTPYPVSLISMTWEGMYSPRYYGRS